MMPVTVNSIAHRLNASTILTDDHSSAADLTPAKLRHKVPKSQSFYQRLKFSSSAPPAAPVDEQPKSADRHTPADEFKGVQTLKQFWINAFGSVRQRRARAHTDVRDAIVAADRRGSRKCATLSVVSAATSPPSSSSNESRDSDATTAGDVRKCATLHRNFVTGSVVDVGEPPAVSSTTPAEPADRRLSNVSSCADNFYKYKTADMVRQQHHNAGPVQPVFAALSSPAAVGAAGTGGCTQIHWARRADVIVSAPEASHHERDTGAVMTVSDDDKSAATDSDTRTADNSSSQIRPSSGKRDTASTTHTTPNTMTIATSITPQSVDPDATHKPPAAAKTLSSSSSISSSTSHTQTQSGGGSGGGVTRKCSFRTNAYQPHSRKMAAAGAGSVGSKVAALTHRFNQLCSQQDARDLIGGGGGGVIVHRSGGRVFRVMKEEEMVKRSGSNRSSADSSPVRSARKRGSVKRRDSRAKKRPDTLPVKVADARTVVSDVADAAVGQVVNRIKPKVPDKSAQVLLRTKEIVKRNLTKTTTIAKETAKKSETTPKLTPLPEFREEDRKESVVNAEPIICPEPAVLADTNPTAATNDENPKKNKYVRIYEKFRPSFLYQKKPASPSHSATQSPTDERSVKKIIDAISAASQRIENLSKSESCLLAPTASASSAANGVEDIGDDTDDYAGPLMKPNQSFLYRTTVFNEASPNGACLVEAINPCVLTKTQSMDDMRFRHSFKMFETHSLLEQPEPETEQNPGKKAEPIENEYEFIQPPAVEVSASEHFAKTAQKKAPICTLYAAPTKPAAQPAVVDSAASQETSTTSHVDCSDIYQSIAEVFNTNQNAIGADRCSVSSYESFGTYQTVDEGLLERIKNENGYEICEQTDPPPEPPPPRQTGLPAIASAVAPPLPMPKRACNNYVLQTSDSMASSNYEHIKYDKQPPRPPKSSPLPATHSATGPPQSAAAAAAANDPSSPETEYDEENIYDTIKPRHRNGSAVANLGGGGGHQTIGGIDYESIESHTSFLRPKRVSKCSADSDTASTLSSDNKTNSLYGTAMSRRDSVSRPPSEGGDNSDDWVDISDGESESRQRDRFVV